MEKKIYGMAMEGRELKKQKAGRIPKWDTATFWDEPYPLNLVREVLGHVTEYRLEENLRPERYSLEKREYIFSLAPEPGGNGSPSISSEQISILMVEFALSRGMADSMDRALESKTDFRRLRRKSVLLVGAVPQTL